MVSVLSSKFQSNWPRVSFMTFGPLTPGPLTQIKAITEFKEGGKEEWHIKNYSFFIERDNWVVQWLLPSLTSKGAAVIAFTSNVKKCESESSKPEKEDSMVGIFPMDQRYTTRERAGLEPFYFLPYRTTWKRHLNFTWRVWLCRDRTPRKPRACWAGGDDEPAALWTQSSAWLMRVAAQGAGGHAANESTKVPRRQGGNMQHLPGPKCKIPSYEHANSKKKSPSFHHLSPCSLTS